LELELVTGGTLADKIAAGPIPERECVRLMTGVLSGLTAIHRAGLVHRDVKPANVLISAEGVPKIADLGIAHELEGARLTRTGASLGTPHYMSPEQIRGHSVSFSTDLYACGVILYEMLTGSPPFDGESEYDVKERHVHVQPDLQRLRERSPEYLVRAVARALAKDPSQRWLTAADFLTAIAAPPNEPEVRPAFEHPSPADQANPLPAHSADLVTDEVTLVRSKGTKPGVRRMVLAVVALCATVCAIAAVVVLVPSSQTNESTREPTAVAHSSRSSPSPSAAIASSSPRSVPTPVPTVVVQPCARFRTGDRVVVTREPRDDDWVGEDGLANSPRRVQGKVPDPDRNGAWVWKLKGTTHTVAWIEKTFFFEDKARTYVPCAIAEPYPQPSSHTK